MRQDPVPWAYRVFARQVGVDPDTDRTPVEQIALDRLKHGGLPSESLLVNLFDSARQKFMKEAAPGHTAVVEVRKQFWNFPVDPQHPGLAPPLLVYADLLATGDARCIETAKMIYDENIVRLFAED
jgi:hypothetical protein